MGEKQYQEPIKEVLTRGVERLGLMTSWAYLDDPKRLAFTFSRYKFVSKMLYGKNQILEIGCGDAFASRLVAQTVGKLTAIDFDQSFIKDANQRKNGLWPIDCFCHDILSGPAPGQYDGIFSLDVLEHISPASEKLFLNNIVNCLHAEGVVIIGMPSQESQTYASPQSKEGHVNCKTQDDFKALMEQYFTNVFMFSMNDEVVHTGFSKMSNYNIALCCNKKT
jgi:cyclopropane fatty-acyl-phospholipid synthase-like methyltransferase